MFVTTLRVDNRTMIDMFQPAFIKGNKWNQYGNKKEQAQNYGAKPATSITSLVRDSGNTTKPIIRPKFRPNPSHNQSNQPPIYEQK